METTFFAMNPWWEQKDFDSGIDRLEYLDRLPVLLSRNVMAVMGDDR